MISNNHFSINNFITNRPDSPEKVFLRIRKLINFKNIKLLKTKNNWTNYENDFDYLIEAGEKKLKNFSVFLDFAKAFNMVNRKVLISILESSNIKGSMLSILKDYLRA